MPRFSLCVRNTILFLFLLLQIQITAKFNYRRIESLHPYPDYIPLPTNANDILVFKVKRPFDLSPTVQLAKLAAPGFNPQGTTYNDTFLSPGHIDFA